MTSCPICNGQLVTCAYEFSGQHFVSPSRTTGAQVPAQGEPPRRTDAEILHAIRTNLDWAIDAAALRLNRLKPGSSAWKTQAGLLRGLHEAGNLFKSETGSNEVPMANGSTLAITGKKHSGLKGYDL